MKSTAVLVNTARGGVVDEDALARAVRERWIWGAGVDVVLGEPNVGGEHVLVKESRCVVLPHVGSATVQTREDMAGLAVRNALVGVGDGEGGTDGPTAFVDFERYK
jgi:glyoxylate/hydroxypyruvate reductase